MNNPVMIAALVLFASSPACAYETGSLTCQMIGEVAAQTLVAKQSGKSHNASLSTFTAPFAADARVERHLVGNIIDTIYRNDLLVAMKPGDAYLVFMRDCMNGKSQDGKR